MRRRSLLVGVGMVAAIPLRLARAQPAAAPRCIGILLNGTPAGGETPLRHLAEGFTSLGRDPIRIEPRYAQGVLARLPALAAELVEARCDVLVGLGGPAAVAASRATPTTPVVFSIVTDPVALGLVATRERPGGHVTGITSLDPQQAGAQMALLREMLPGLRRLGILSDHTIPGADAAGLAPIDRANVEAARAQGLEPVVHKLARPTAEGAVPDLAAAFAALQAEGAQAVLILELPLAFAHRNPIAEAALARRMPTMFPGGMSQAGGLVTYGTNVADTWPRIPAMVERILEGEPPAAIAVETVTRRELVFNLRTAEAIGAVIPEPLLARSDQVIR